MEYVIDASSDTENRIHDNMWELVKGGNKTYDIPAHYFNGPITDGHKLEVSVKSSYARGKKTYPDFKTLMKELFNNVPFSKKRAKYTRRIELTVQIKLNNWLTQELLDSTKMTMYYSVNSTNLTEACLGLSLFSWDDANSNLYFEHPVDISEIDIRNQGLLIMAVAKNIVKPDNTQKRDELLKAFNIR